MSDQTDMNKGFLKEKLGNYQVDPPEKVWNEISGQIGGGRSRKGMYLLLLVSAASIALVITLGIHFFSSDMPQQESYMEEFPVEEEVTKENTEGGQFGLTEGSKLEQKVVETLAALPDDSTVPSEDEKDPKQGELDVKLPEDNGQPGEVQLTMAMQQIDIVESEHMNQANEELDPDLATDPDPATDPDLATEPDPATDPDLATEPDLAIDLDSVPDLDIDPFPLMEQDHKRDPRWMLGAALSPLYSFRDAESGAMSRDPAESGMLSYSTGVHVSYRRSSRLAIETGIYYNKTGIVIGAPGIQEFSQNYDNMVFGAGSEETGIKSVTNSVGNIIAYSGDIYMNGYKIKAENSANGYASDVLKKVEASESGIQQHLDYLELPFNLRYSVIDRTIELQLVGGVSTNFLISNYVTMETSSGQEEIGYLSNVNTVNYSGNAGLGMIYHMGKKLSFIVEPRFRYFLNSVNDSSLPSTRPYSLGLYTGLSYTF